MPRIKPTTTFTPRNKPSTQYTKPREREEYPVSFDSVEITFDSTDYTWDMIFEDLGPLVTVYSTPRKWYMIQDLTLEFVVDLSWEQVLSLQGTWNQSDVINTKWT